MKERILVTGGAGFLGSYLCRCLLDQGKQVVCVDNLYTGTKRNILPMLENPDFTFLQHDVVEPLNLEVNAIYNLACPASPVHYQKDHVQTVRTLRRGKRGLLQNLKFESTFSYGENGVY